MRTMSFTRLCAVAWLACLACRAPTSLSTHDLATHFCDAIDRHCPKPPIKNPVCVTRLVLQLQVPSADDQKELDSEPLPWPGEISAFIETTAARCDDYKADQNTLFDAVRVEWLTLHPLPAGRACLPSSDPDYRPCATPDGGTVTCISRGSMFNKPVCVQRILVAQGQPCESGDVERVCADPALSCSGGVCKEAQAGDPCTRSGDLDMCVGLYCDGAQCIDLAGPGQTCVSNTGSTEIAVTGVYSDNCQDPGTYCDSICVSRKNAGEPCQQYDQGSQCANGLVCSNSVCTKP
jgi:hypothetical protein